MSFVKFADGTEHSSVLCSVNGVSLQDADSVISRMIAGGRLLMNLPDLTTVTCAMRQVCMEGTAPGYEFWLQMPEHDATEWLKAAVKDAMRYYKNNPDAAIDYTLLGNLDAVRARRKEKKRVAQQAAKIKKMQLGD